MFSAVWLLVSAAPLTASPSPAAVTTNEAATLRGFQAVASGTGWVWTDQGLFWTADGGQLWTEITTPTPVNSQLRAVAFTDRSHGWAVTTAWNESGEVAYALARTTDGGRTWHTATLDLFAPGEAAAQAGAVFLEFVDVQTGWLVVKQATSDLFSLGTLFATRDGGRNWARRSIPIGAPIHFQSALEGRIDPGPVDSAGFITRDGGRTWSPQKLGTLPVTAAATAGGLTDLSLASPQIGWAREAAGRCTGGACVLRVALRQTTDAGQTWAALPLPGGRRALERTFAEPAAAMAATAAGGLALSFQGHGFDSCVPSAGLPSLADMQTWWLNSPYRVHNLYLGGISLPNCGTLTKTYVQALAQQGWLFIPTWVGPQPYCSNFNRKMSSDPAIAYQQGKMEAYLALDAAQSLGLTPPDQSGTVLYYDVEAYPPGDLACREVAKTFIAGWTAALHASGSYAGVYGSPCGSYLRDYATLAEPPDQVWLAVWSYPAYEPGASVWNLPCVDNSLWSNAQRLRQYTGGHAESWGGPSITIDSNVLNGLVATTTGGCTPGAGQAALFVHPQFGGQCVLKSAGSYPTAASLGLPAGSISSVRLGPEVSLRLCRGEFHTGVCEDFVSDAADIAGHAIGDDLAASAVVSALPPAWPERQWLPRISMRPSVTSPVPNGGFESGPSAWSAASVLQRPIIVPAGDLPAYIAPHSGSWAAWLGGVDGETGSLQQTVLVPAGAPFLSYWQKVDSAESRCHYDTASVWVNNAVVDAYGLCASASPLGWAPRSLDLSAYAGQAVLLRIQVTTDGSLPTSLFLDDVALQSAP